MNAPKQSGCVDLDVTDGGSEDLLPSLHLPTASQVNLQLINIPPGLRERFERVIETTAESLGVTVEEARRVVEQTIIQRGIESLESTTGAKKSG